MVPIGDGNFLQHAFDFVRQLFPILLVDGDRLGIHRPKICAQHKWRDFSDFKGLCSFGPQHRMVHQSGLQHVIEVRQTATNTGCAFDALQIPQVHAGTGNFAALDIRKTVDRLLGKQLVRVQHNTGRQIHLVLLFKLALHRRVFLGDLVNGLRHCAGIRGDERRYGRQRLTGQFGIVKDRRDNADVAQPQLDAFQHALGLDDRPAIAFLPIHDVIAGFCQTLVDFGNEKVGEFLHPQRARRIAINNDGLDFFLCHGRNRCQQCKRCGARQFGDPVFHGVLPVGFLVLCFGPGHAERCARCFV